MQHAEAVMRLGSRTTAKLCLGALLLLAPGIAAAADATWPRELNTDLGVLTIYQPQPEKFTDNILTGRAAISLVPKGKSVPIFGVFWFTGRVDTDRDAGTAMVRDIAVTNSRWPDSNKEQEEKFSAFLTTLMPQTGVPISLDRLRASLATAEQEQKSTTGLKHDAPRVVVVQESAELLLYDGEPRPVAIPNTQLERMVNTAYAVVRDKQSGTCYLSGGKLWYSAPDPKGPWTPIAAPPAEIAKLVPPDTSKAPAPAPPPRILVATEPTELIWSDGPPSWQSLEKGDLMYIANTESRVVREVASGKVFILVSGRWYGSASLDGPWTVVRPDQLPSAFKEIPPSSPLGDVRVSVAGTPEAQDAMLDAFVPQTTAIERSKAALEVKYDGEPQFKTIDGTSVAYAVNTQSQVLLISGKYYACDQAVWYVANGPKGPWAVADSVPMDEIKKIPPSEPVYNVTYVTVYESTPQVVYVGYTPGYVYSYPWYGVPIYGTGWYYPPYVSPHVYYPRPVTYGMHVSYNPWTGWGFGFSVSNGFMSIGVGFGGMYGGYYRPPYYPPCGYRPPYYGGYPGHPGGYPGRPGGPGYRPGSPGAPGGPGGRPGGPSTLPATRPGSDGAGTRPSTLPSNNLYKDGSNQARNAPGSMQRDAGLQKADRVAKGPNNVYADRSGNVQRQSSKGWESRSNQGQWKSSPSSSQMNRDAQARSRGASSSYGGNRSSYGGRPSGGSSARSSTGMRSSGGRRR